MPDRLHCAVQETPASRILIAGHSIISARGGNSKEATRSNLRSLVFSSAKVPNEEEEEEEKQGLP